MQTTYNSGVIVKNICLSKIVYKIVEYLDLQEYTWELWEYTIYFRFLLHIIHQHKGTLDIKCITRLLNKEKVHESSEWKSTEHSKERKKIKTINTFYSLNKYLHSTYYQSATVMKSGYIMPSKKLQIVLSCSLLERQILIK